MQDSESTAGDTAQPADTLGEAIDEAADHVARTGLLLTRLASLEHRVHNIESRLLLVSSALEAQAEITSHAAALRDTGKIHMREVDPLDH